MANQGGLEIGRSHCRVRSPLPPPAIGMQKQATIATVHHGHPQTHEASRAIAEFMRDPVPFWNGICAKQHRCNLTVSRTVETAIEGAQGEHEPASPGLGKCCWIGARPAAIESTPETEGSGCSDFKELVKWQQDCSRICSATVQVHPHFDAEALDDIIAAFSGQYWIKRQRPGLESWVLKLRRKLGQGNDAWQSLCRPKRRLWIIRRGEIVTPSAGRTHPLRLDQGSFGERLVASGRDLR